MTPTWEGEGVGVLKFVTCFRILLFLNNKSTVHFCGQCWWQGGGGGEGVDKKMVIFCERHKCMISYDVLMD